jgi:type I protein arginine methyltransferase
MLTTKLNAAFLKIISLNTLEERSFQSEISVLCCYDPEGVVLKFIRGKFTSLFNIQTLKQQQNQTFFFFLSFSSNHHQKKKIALSAGSTLCLCYANNLFFFRTNFSESDKTITNGNADESYDLEFEVLVTKQTALKKQKELHVINAPEEIVFLRLATKDEDKQLDEMLKKVQNVTNSVFLMRTEDSSANQYFQFYGYLSQQQNMMQDFVRTSTYQKAIHGNFNDFNGKIVLDVGAGSGILSFFAAQAGAGKVYAVEASNMAQYAQELVAANNLSDRITVIAGKIEEIELPEKVDIIISEPMGYMLYNERMLETYLHAKKWLKPNGKMFPGRGDLHVAPFTDEALYIEQYNKANFWCQSCFHNVDLSSLRDAAMKEYFRQPIVDTFDIRICQAKSIRHVVDFLEANEEDLHRIGIQSLFLFFYFDLI